MPAHDAFNRLLKSMPHDTEALWRDASRFVGNGNVGVLVLGVTYSVQAVFREEKLYLGRPISKKVRMSFNKK